MPKRGKGGIFSWDFLGVKFTPKMGWFEFHDVGVCILCICMLYVVFLYLDVCIYIRLDG